MKKTDCIGTGNSIAIKPTKYIQLHYLLMGSKVKLLFDTQDIHKILSSDITMCKKMWGNDLCFAGGL